MSIRDILLAILVVAIWGFNFVVIKVGVADVPPLLLTGLRFLAAALPLVFFVKRPKTHWGYIAAYGFILGVIKFGMLFTAIKLGASASLASIVTQMQAFFTIGFAFLLLRETPKIWQIIGAVIAFSGMAIMGFEQAADAQFVPFLLLIAVGASWGVANIIIKKAGQIDMFSFIVWASLVPPLPLFVLSWLIEDQDAIVNVLTSPTAISIGAVFYLAYAATIIGFAIWNQLLKKYPTSLVAPFSLLVPLFGILSGVLILGETMSTLAIIGGGVIFLGLLLNVFGERIAIFIRKKRAI
ncbi:EamA family transporter [Maritalea porphyrae]|uniref:EamA family transporter n=1 Tax=Maritalea porphyrae TaxID=880732 RepID=UPI0022B01593|nr:EamA family transporter [Maritalea porphyrae]MCZ4272760.1 EamA family transporter [Maritalea porphyrae]